MDFFKGVFQFEVEFEGSKAKIPIFYRDASAIVGLFPAVSKKVKKLIPEKLKLREIAPEITLVGIACFEYKDTDIGKYKEIGVTAPVEIGRKKDTNGYLTLPRRLLSFTALPLNITNFLKEIVSGKYEVNVIHLPVTTEIARVAGVEIYNYPKFVAKIDVDAEKVHAELSENTKDGKEIFRVEKSKGFQIFSESERKLNFVTYQEKDGEIIKAEVLVKAEGIKYFIGGLELKTNKETEIGKELDEIIILKKSIFSMIIPKMQAILHLPVKIR